MPHAARVFFEILPIAAALVAIFACGYRATVTKDKVLRVVCLAGVFNAVLMIAAQVSWSWSYFVQGSLLGTELANIMWTVLNVSTMSTAAYLAYGEQR